MNAPFARLLEAVRSHRDLALRPLANGQFGSSLRGFRGCCLSFLPGLRRHDARIWRMGHRCPATV